MSGCKGTVWFGTLGWGSKGTVGCGSKSRVGWGKKGRVVCLEVGCGSKGREGCGSSSGTIVYKKFSTIVYIISSTVVSASSRSLREAVCIVTVTIQQCSSNVASVK